MICHTVPEDEKQSHEEGRRGGKKKLASYYGEMSASGKTFRGGEPCPCVSVAAAAADRQHPRP